MINIGVLSLQGSIEEHIYMLSLINDVNPCKVKTNSDLDNISGLIIPGGESTTIGKLINDFNLFEKIIIKAKNNLPIWGTCAGMILMAKNISNENYSHLGIMDITVRRNAYGSQLNSFISQSIIPTISTNKLPLIFIRAPYVEEVCEDVEILATLNKKIVAVKQKNMLATSFHPELSNDLTFHKYFVNICKNTNEEVRLINNDICI